MDLLDFFDLSKKLERVIVPGGASQSKKKPLPLPVEESSESEDEKEYAKEYQMKEDEELSKNYFLADLREKQKCGSQSGGMMDLEEMTTTSYTPNVTDLCDDDVHDKYSFENNSTLDLPINIYKEQIISMVETNPVTIIQGFTGCGKTTQVPQFILDAHAKKRMHCNIIVTQPRRLAAISISQRVVRERQWPLGSIVGYQVGFDNKTSPDTRLTYCTTGVLLQKLIFKRDMNEYTHVILDEVHERDQDMDFVLLVVRKLLRSNSRTVKVILMSATFDVSRFSKYFSMPVGSNLEPAPIITVEQERKYSVTEWFVDQLAELGQVPDVKIDEPGISDTAYQLASRLIKIFDLIEEKEFEAAKPSPDVKRALAFKGSVLVFLPGINEIESLLKLLNEEQERSFTMKHRRYKWWVIPLHSSITSEEQNNVFKSASPGQRKIILSTNIAESSITVPDIKFVIDFCLTKQLVVDSQTSFSSLQTTWASKTNCIQRSGRVGRVCDGRVYKMISKEFYLKHLKNECLPEILRCPLDRLVLQTKLLNMGEPKAILALSLDPPDLTHLKNTILKLKEIGALLMKTGDKYTPHDGDITFLGRVMAKLPVDVHISKLIVFGHIFNVLEECVIMGAAMSTKSVFSAPFNERLKAYHSKLTWANSSCSDCVAFLNAYKLWRSSQMHGFFNRMAGDNEKGWARRHFIQLKPMHEVDALVKDLFMRLRRIGIEEPVGDFHNAVPKQERPLIFKVVIAGAFYPNYFVRGAQGGQINEREAVKQLLDRDPFTTVFLQGMPANQPGELYVKSIRRALKGCSENLRISFESSSKVFIQFPRLQSMEKIGEERDFVANIPGKVAMPVYRAIKLRQLKIPIIIHFLPIHEAKKRAESLGLTSRSLFEQPFDHMKANAKGVDIQVPLPCIDESKIKIQISHVIDPGHFWAQKVDKSTCDQLQRLIILLNGLTECTNSDEEYVPPPELPLLKEQPQIGKVYAAPFEDTCNWYYRARVTSIMRASADVQVFFVDYGNTLLLNANKLRDFTPEMIKGGILDVESQAFECVLSEIQPSVMKNTVGLWSSESIQVFEKLVVGKVLFGKVYSVVHGVISLELKENKSDSLTINQKMIEMGYAERADESYLSKVNHDLRLQDAMEPEMKKAYNQQQDQDLVKSSCHLTSEPEPPSLEDCRTSEQLRGPFSPLEMKLFHQIKAGMSKEVMIEWNSVNSVLLDTEPHDPHDRLLVAASVGQNPDGGRLTLRHTTLMPNIHGLPALIALIFCPTVELRTNPEHTKLTGALCGLGYDPVTKRSLFPDHDMEIAFDTEINMEDLVNINKLRYWINFSLHTNDGEEVPDNGPKDISKYQAKVKEFLFNVLIRRRRSQELFLNINSMQWGLIPKSELIDPGYTPLDDRAAFRLHSGVKLELRSELDEVTKAQLEHIKDLRRMATENGPFREVTCNLCGVSLLSTLELRLHLESARHKDLEEDLVNNC